MYNLNNIMKVKIGEKLRDSFVGSDWIVVEKSSNSVTLKQIGKEKNQIRLKPDSFFFELTTIE